MKYRSVDVSPYACETYGHELRDISGWRARERFDLVICHSVLQYLDDAGAARAIDNLGAMCRGLLYLEAITRADLEVVDVARTDTAVHARSGSLVPPPARRATSCRSAQGCGPRGGAACSSTSSRRPGADAGAPCPSRAGVGQPRRWAPVGSLS